MILEILFAVSLFVNAVFVILLVRAVRKLLQMDELLSLLIDDVAVNTKYFDKLLTTPTFENSPEVQQAHKNMKIISDRMDEFSLRMQELAGKIQRPVVK